MRKLEFTFKTNEECKVFKEIMQQSNYKKVADSYHCLIFEKDNTTIILNRE